METKQNEKKNASKPALRGGCGSLITPALIFLMVVLGIGTLLLISAINEAPCVWNCGSVANPPTSKDKLAQKEGIKKFKDYQELKKFLSENGNSMYEELSSGGIMTDGMAGNKSVERWGAAENPQALPPASIGGGGDDYSTTNIQVSGVDEADLVKTDGKYIYAVSNNNINIIEAYPAENAGIVSTIKLDSGPQSIYVNGDKLAVYGYDHNVYSKGNYEEIKPIRRNSGYVFLKIYDLSDRKNPKLERDLSFEGNYMNSRMIGDYLYFMTSNYNYYAYMDDDMPVPIILENGEVASGTMNGAKCLPKSGARCINPDIYYFDIPYNSFNFVTVSAVNLADKNKGIGSEIYLLDGSQNTMFVSQNNIYITFTKYVSEEELILDTVKEMILPRLSSKDRDRIVEIEKTENYILSPQEKMAKIMMILQKFSESLTDDEQKQLEKELEQKIKQKYEDISKELEKTIVHKIAIDKGNIKYKSAGEVPGSVLNQFSMNEDGGYFYIATTRNQNWSRFADNQQRQSYSNIYALDSDMKVAGKIEKLAEGERIYSVRFMQNRAYMVTFRQTDPLFVIDLTNPTNPKVLGKLKVPGFSTYLHPYDNTTLIGLGKETDENGRVTGGIKLSLFDVSDVSNPKELDKYVLGDSSSNSLALNDHKAFLFSKEKNLLVIPINMRSVGIMNDEIPPSRSGVIIPRSPMPPLPSSNFNGAAVFSIDKYRFNLRGKISHSDSSYDYNAAVTRSLYIKDMLYTLSSAYIKANSLDDLKEIKKLSLDALQEKIDNVFEYFKKEKERGINVNWEYIHGKLNSILSINHLSDMASPAKGTDAIDVGGIIELPLRKIYPEK